MKHRLKIASALIVAFATAPMVSKAEQNIPVPQKRPEKLSVSPAYIKQLMERQKSDARTNLSDHAREKDGNVETLFDEEVLIPHSKISNINAQDIVELLETDNTLANISEPYFLNEIMPAANNNVIPIPLRKPKADQDIPSVTATKQPKAKQADKDSAIISFALEADQVKLDYDLQSFLSDHALEIFKRNSAIKLDIQAYAKIKNGNQNSNVRLSLARALEVRKYLMAQGISPSRLKLSAIGHDKEGANSNRIDLVFSKDI